jgi:hypothetical protein
LTGSCARYQALIDITKSTHDRFMQAYQILAETCYLPENIRKGYIQFLRRAGIQKEKMPTKLRTLAYKIELDSHLEHLTAKIYEHLDLRDC